MESSIPFVNIITGGQPCPPVMNYGTVFVLFDHHEDTHHYEMYFPRKYMNIQVFSTTIHEYPCIFNANTWIFLYFRWKCMNIRVFSTKIHENPWIFINVAGKYKIIQKYFWVENGNTGHIIEQHFTLKQPKGNICQWLTKHST